MKHPELLVVIGANGAGKTTWARKNRDLLPQPFYNADSIAEGLGDANSTDLQTGVIGRFVPRITVTTKNDLRSMWWRFSKLLFLRRRSALTLDRTRSRPR